MHYSRLPAEAAAAPTLEDIPAPASGNRTERAGGGTCRPPGGARGPSPPLPCPPAAARPACAPSGCPGADTSAAAAASPASARPRPRAAGRRSASPPRRRRQPRLPAARKMLRLCLLAAQGKRRRGTRRTDGPAAAPGRGVGAAAGSPGPRSPLRPGRDRGSLCPCSSESRRGRLAVTRVVRL